MASLAFNSFLMNILIEETLDDWHTCLVGSLVIQEW